MDSNIKLILEQGEPFSNPGKYRRLVGKLNYLIVTQLGTTFPVSVVSLFLNFPCESHWNVVTHILQYIKFASRKGLLYEDRGHEKIVGYSDADYAGSPSDR